MPVAINPSNLSDLANSFGGRRDYPPWMDLGLPIFVMSPRELDVLVNVIGHSFSPM
jgi:hypothetical protein